jgi:hypothetical protein
MCAGVAVVCFCAAIEGLLGGSELRGEVGPFSAVALPGYEDGYGQENWNENLREL